MKYIKKFENIESALEGFSSKSKANIIYIGKKMSIDVVWSIRYITDVIEKYKMKEKHIHNLKLAIEYNYFSIQYFKHIADNIFNFGYVSNTLIEMQFKASFEKNFKNKIIEFKKPYPICVKKPYNLDPSFKNEKHPYTLIAIDDLNSYQVNDVIGEIPKEYPFNKKYLVGLNRYRGENEDRESIWEKYKNTKRESEFIRVFDENDIHILTEKDIEQIHLNSITKKYNL